MNRFRTKRKVKDEISAPRPSQDSESSMAFRPFRKGKKTQEPEKVELDLSSALPSTDEFRTSLLMTGLSARFSMLREQDDPNTKIGKASDDSVLFPKRQSRLDYGGFRGLGDIAEVESIRAAAPFARKNSYNSDDADSMTASSIMGRSKPIEGNNLFGGRQKIYKIPVGANSSKTLGGGMGGRALYDDDVALSAFQKWRQAERERKSSDDERDDGEKRSWVDLEADVLRADSPILSNYNQKRETSSTTFSIPSLARNSTAATSVASSQRAPSLKDWQPSTSSTPTLERSVTRTRRLYESGLNNDLHEQQSSALSRIDTLSRQRTFGTRTPDLVQNSPSPTTIGFTERFGGERKILAKSSAPNLRSMSPPTTASSAGTPDLGVRVPSITEMRSNYGGAPPLSPPISESEENSILPIHPSDRGKATALGVFQKPLQPYDESRYAQRQLQRQQGRETPTQKSRDEQNTSSMTDRSSSSSSVLRNGLDSKGDAAPTVTESPRYEHSTSFLADPNDSDSSPAVSPKPIISPQVLLRRPSDREHPAFRDSAIPTPLSVASRLDGEPSPIAENPASLSPNPKGISPTDSPTLGPTTGAGLSGMVRQHLRGDSNASSIYGALPPTSGLESRFPLDPDATQAFHDLGASTNPWNFPDTGRDWTLDLDVNEPMPDAQSRSSNVLDPEDFRGIGLGTESNNQDDRDEFASQLADGARRIRERLTTYVESDSRSASPHRLGESMDSRDLPPPPRQNGLGLLRPKSSRGSLADRGRDVSQSKAMKMLGIGAPGNPPPANSVREMMNDENTREPKSLENNDWDDGTNDTEEPHAGLRAFRQARRELQRMKEQETQAKHQQQLQDPIPDVDPPRSTPSRDRPAGQRSPERDRKPPPVYYQQRLPSEESRNGNRDFRSQEQFRSDRDRSGSDSSNEARSRSRSGRSRNGSGARSNLQIGSNGAVPRPPMRSPGLPGTDIKRSPIMPPQPYPGSTQNKQSNFASNGNLHLQTSRDYESGQPSPISPIPSPYAAHGPSTPATLPSSPRPVPSPNHGPDSVASNINDSMRRKIRTKDISDPTFVMSTSRVPTVALPDAPRNRSRSNSRTAPPLPPINPRRRQDFSSTRAVFDNLSRRNGDSFDGEASASMPNLTRGKSTDRDEDPRPDRRRIRPMASDGLGLNSRMPSNAPPINVGPPASRQVVTQGAKRPGMGLPGGMI
ncbi:hypothetical protein F4677DRAFT_430282 [Hypoxylon crocopeplum]|nr:hypothetical protein F4677DRAFT_430282 [Hypoxylon crocopeplum]